MISSVLVLALLRCGGAQATRLEELPKRDFVIPSGKFWCKNEDAHLMKPNIAGNVDAFPVCFFKASSGVERFPRTSLGFETQDVFNGYMVMEE